MKTKTTARRVIAATTVAVALMGAAASPSYAAKTKVTKVAKAKKAKKAKKATKVAVTKAPDTTVKKK